MSFNLTNALITFQIYINKRLQELVDIIYIIYLNNKLIFNENSTKHRRHVQQVFERFKNFELYVNLKKYKFNIEKIEFLNFIMFMKEIRMNSKQIQMIKKWFKLKIYREMQIFLKFVNFDKRFIYYYFKIIALLTSLFKNSKNEKKKDLLKWSNEVEQTFRQLKNIFISIFFLFIMISWKEIEWKLIFLILLLRAFSVNRTRITIIIRWRFDRARWYSQSKIIKFMIKNF